MNTRIKTCNWCGLDYPKKWQLEKHECPSIFLHKMSEKQVIIRGKKLNIQWNGNKIKIFSEVKP